MPKNLTVPEMYDFISMLDEGIYPKYFIKSEDISDKFSGVIVAKIGIKSRESDINEE